MLSVSPLSRFTGSGGHLSGVFRVFFAMCFSVSVLSCPFLVFSSFLVGLGEVPGVLFSALGRLLQQRLAPSILNDSTVF